MFLAEGETRDALGTRCPEMSVLPANFAGIRCLVTNGNSMDVMMGALEVCAICGALDGRAETTKTDNSTVGRP